MNIRDTIVRRRRERIQDEGHSFGSNIPEVRTAPVQPFDGANFVIGEIKRKSPSRGSFAPNLDPVEQARRYYEAGIRTVSVLTEEDHFQGSLEDLLSVKAAFPDMAVLRKDFLVDVEDISTSYRAGADAVLLIASMLEAADLDSLYAYARELGLAVLVEVHSLEEVLKVRHLRPRFVGINSRDLEDFSMDLLLPPMLRQAIDWNCKVIFESGIFAPHQARYAKLSGHAGVLVGEALVRDASLGARLVRACGEVTSVDPPAAPDGFWALLARRLFYLRHPANVLAPAYPGPLVKICGICRVEDAELAVSLGADVLGFVFAESPRRTTIELLRKLRDLPVLKVVVTSFRAGELAALPAGTIPDPEVRQVFEEGLADALQLHGDEDPAWCAGLNLPWYKALRPESASDEAVAQVEAYRAPRVLFDAWSPVLAGGTGKRVAPAIIKAFAPSAGPNLVAKSSRLWLAGGLGPDNIREVLDTCSPELVDASSRLESEPGRKDPELLRSYFKEIHSGN